MVHKSYANKVTAMGFKPTIRNTGSGFTLNGYVTW